MDTKIENHSVIFEMVNGEKHNYEMENMSIESIFKTLNETPTGWINFTVDGETHFLKADKIVLVKITPHSV